MSDMDIKTERLKAWRDNQAAIAKGNDEEFFMGLPDAWYEPPHWGCPNGHVSLRYLKSELRGAICLACRQPLWLIPEISEEEFQAVLSTD